MAIFVLLAVSAGLCLGFFLGRNHGRKEIAGRIIRHVIDSPKYENRIVQAIQDTIREWKV